MSLLVLVVDDEPDVEMPFRQLFRRDLRSILCPFLKIGNSTRPASRAPRRHVGRLVPALKFEVSM